MGLVSGLQGPVQILNRPHGVFSSLLQRKSSWKQIDSIKMDENLLLELKNDLIWLQKLNESLKWLLIFLIQINLYFHRACKKDRH
jgi:hypothetical protein